MTHDKKQEKSSLVIKPMAMTRSRAGFSVLSALQQASTLAYRAEFWCFSEFVAELAADELHHIDHEKRQREGTRYATWFSTASQLGGQLTPAIQTADFTFGRSKTFLLVLVYFV